MNRTEFPQLETNRLILREMTLEDLEFYFRHFNKNEIVEGCCFPGPRNLEAARQELEFYCMNPFKENNGVRWGIVYRANGELIGTCGLYNWDKDSRRAEVGYDLEPTYWGQGIMPEALRAALEYAFQKMNLNRVQALTDSRNIRSMNLARRLGFKKEGVMRQRSYFNERFRDDVIFSILREEWTKS